MTGKLIAMACAALSLTACAKDEFMWGLMLQLGHNMWAEAPLWGEPESDAVDRYAAPRNRTDDNLWNEVTAYAAKKGVNAILIDLGEGMVYPSHPELAVEGSWSPERMKMELARLRSLGLEPIPKLNFSTCHDSWLKEYQRMVSTRKYYQVCEDLIKDVAEIFDHPRYFHLGYDEETAGHQKHHLLAICRQGELWWHDFLWFAKVTENTGCRPWIWSDYVWNHKDEFLNRMPKSVIQSNWYYGKSFDYTKMGDRGRYVEAYEWLDKAGFDQIPTGSNWSCDENFPETVKFCDAKCGKSRIRGYMMAPWTRTFAIHEKKSMEAISIMAQTIKSRKA